MCDPSLGHLEFHILRKELHSRAADFCASQVPNFNRERWIDYIAGECGQRDELIFVEPDSTLIHGAIVED
jgi:hypothetical protein